MKATTTSWTVTGLGAAVSSLGIGILNRRNLGKLGAGVLGFGLAHVALGLLDMMRPSVRR
ncbi:MAG: hypothetical protein ACM3ZC_15915 [Bacteroidota bacterium]